MVALIAKSFKFVNFELDGPKRVLRKQGEAVPLNSKAFDLLVVLVERHGEIVSKDELLEAVWPGQFVEEGNLTVQISALRKAFGERKDEHRFIVTVPGRGYCFVAELENLEGGEIVLESRRYSHIVVKQDESIAENDAIQPAQSPADRRSRGLTMGRLTAFAFLALAAAGLGYWFFAKSSDSGSIKSIAVMPFVNESGNADAEYLSDGMTESLINSLSRLPKLSVKARSTVFRYKGKDVLPSQVGADLNVGSVLSGRVVERGGQVTVYLSLIDVPTGNQIWGDQYVRGVTDLLSLQSEIARDVSQKLRTKLSRADEQNLAKNYTENAEAFQLYLKGRYLWNKFTPAEHLQATEYFRQAIAKDPAYALAYVGLADTYGSSAVMGWMSPKEGYLKAKAAVKKALEIDDTNAHAHASLGAMYMFSDFDWTAAEREYVHALELDPNDEIAHELYSYLLTASRRHDEAIKEAKRAMELDPLSANISDDLALAYYLAGQYDQAIKQNIRTLEIEPDRPVAHVWLGNILEQKGMYDEAIAAYQKAIDFSERTSNNLAYLGHAYAMSGKKNEAVKILSEMKEMSNKQYVSSYDLAIIYVGLREKAKALDHLNLALDERSGWIINLAVDPFFNILRGEPRFLDLTKRIGP